MVFINLPIYLFVQILLCVQDDKKEKKPSFRYRISWGESGIFSGKATMPGLFPPKGRKAFKKSEE